MRKVLLSLIFLWLSIPALAQIDAIQGYCNTGGAHAMVQNKSATNFQQGDIPSCTVTVYLTGTTTKATIYKDSIFTPLTNPFTAITAASPNPGYWLFYAADGQGYDVTLSGGIPPNNYITPVTYIDLKVGTGGGPPPPGYSIQVNGVPLAVQPPANFINSATVTFTNIAGTDQVQATAAIPGGGGCSSGGIATTSGIVNGDNTSTNCGYNNRIGDTATTPANVSTFGYTLLGTNSGQNVVAMGNQNNTNNKANDVVTIGDQNGANFDTHAGNDVLIGNVNMVGSVAHPCQLNNTINIGTFNLNPCPLMPFATNHGDVVNIGDSNMSFVGNTGANARMGDLVNIGYNNFLLTNPSTNPFGAQAFVCIGNNNCEDLTNGNPFYNTDVVAIGDQNVFGYPTNGGSTTFTLNEIVGVGDANVAHLPAGTTTTTIVGIGLASGTGCAGIGTPAACTTNQATDTIQDLVGIGDSSGSIESGADVVAIGDNSVAGLTAGYSTGHDIIGIGNHACVANTSGTDNICIGDYAGSVGADPAVGNGNQTGSHNVWIGDLAGPGSTTQISNTVAIGFNAQPTTSNTIWLGSTTTTNVVIPGIQASSSTSCLQISTTGVITNTGGPCGGSSPLTTKGDIYVYSSTNTRLPVGTDGQVLSAASTQVTGLQWISAFTNPMTTLGDTVYGGASGAVTRLPGNTALSTLCLVETGTGTVANAPSWSACSGSSATALSSITAATAGNTINSGANAIQWNWNLNVNNTVAFAVQESIASTGTGTSLMNVATLIGSNAIPMIIGNNLNGAQTFPALKIVPTWNTSGVVDAALLLNVTSTASGTGSLLIDLQVGGTSQFKVDKVGNVTQLGTLNSTSVGGITVTGTPTASQVLTATSGTAANWQSPATGVSSISNVDGTLTISPNTGNAIASLNVAHGNTWSVLTTFSAGINLSGGSAPLQLNSAPGTTGQCLVSAGTGNTPTWGACGAITLTTTGTSGLATLVSTTLNIPHYADSGANLNITSLAGLTTPLSVPQGGTGAATGSGYAFGNGTSAFTFSSTIPGSAVAGNIPGFAANLYGTPALPNGTTATTQAAGDNSTKLATTAYVATPGPISPTAITMTGGGVSRVGIPGGTFSALTAAYPCASNAGNIAVVSDSTTTTWGAAVSGGGTSTVLAFCDGSSYTVAAQ